MNKRAFTLPELLVIIFILIILGTIGSFTYFTFTLDSRDSNRVNQLKNIGDGIDLTLSRGTSLIPDNGVEIFVDGVKYSYQGELSDDILTEIKYFGNGLDPKTQSPFVYALSANNRNYDLFSFLENSKNSPKQTFSEDFVYNTSGYSPYIYGKNLTGIITDGEYLPINYNLTGIVDIDCSVDEGYKLIFDNGKILSPIMWQSDFEFGPCYDENILSFDGPSTPISYDNLLDLLASCNIDSSTFSSNFDPVTRIYSGNIICNGSGIDDSGLTFFNELRGVNGDFNLSNNFITDLSPLSNLEYVSGNFLLNNNQIVNALALATRSSNNFGNINLSNNNLTNLEGVRNLNSLETLNISNNNITDISSISSMNNIQILNLSNNNITDMSSIGGRNSLIELNLSNNNISNISSIFGLNNLTYLNLSDNNISSIYPLRQSNSLFFLNLSGNDLLNDLSDLNSISSISRTLQLNSRNYDGKIQSSSPICNNWNILNHNGNTFPNIGLICN